MTTVLIDVTTDSIYNLPLTRYRSLGTYITIQDNGSNPGFFASNSITIKPSSGDSFYDGKVSHFIQTSGGSLTFTAMSKVWRLMNTFAYVTSGNATLSNISSTNLFSLGPLSFSSLTAHNSFTVTQGFDLQNAPTVQGDLLVISDDLVSTGTGLGSAGFISSFSDMKVTLISTYIGLGGYGYISTPHLRSTVQGLGQTYVSTSWLTSTFQGLGPLYLSTPALTSTVAGLGSFGYISTASFSSTINGLGMLDYISTQHLTSTVSNIYLLTSSNNQSTFANLGNTYISSASLVSTVRGISSIYIVPSNLTSTSLGLSGNYTAAIDSTITGLATLGYISSRSLFSTVTSIILSNQSNVAGQLSSLGSTYISSLSLTSTLQGLGNLYISTNQLTSTTTGMVNNNSTDLASTVGGLGNLYLSTGHLVSTTRGLFNAVTFSVPSTVDGMGSIYISSMGIQSTVAGLGTAKYISRSQLTSTTSNLVSGGALTITSTIAGLGTIGYISTAQMVSTVNSFSNTYRLNLLSMVNNLGYSDEPILSSPSIPTLPNVLNATVIPTSPILTGLQLWLDATDPYGTGVTPANGTAITTWTDKSGNGKNATSAGSAVPVYSNGSITTGTSTNLSYSSPYVNSSSETIFIVCTWVETGDYHNIDLVNGTSGNFRQTGIYNSRIGVNYPNNPLAATPRLIGGPTYLVEYELTTTRSKIYINGTLSVSGEGYPYAQTTTILGGNQYGQGGTISEVLIYNSILSTEQREGVEQYLGSKWKLQDYQTVSPALWLDGADPSGNGIVPANGTVVSTWVDKSGNGGNATGNGTFSNGIVLNGSAYYRAPYPGVHAIETGFMVVNFTSLASPVILAGGPNRRELVCFPSDVSVKYFLYNTAITSLIGSSTIPSVGVNVVLAYSYTASRSVLYLNGVQVGLGGGLSPVADDFLYFGRNYVDGNYVTGKISEVIIYTSELSIRQRKAVEEYLACKWQIQGSLTPGRLEGSVTPTLWLDGADPNGNGILPANGTVVSRWVDKSGNGNHGTGSGTFLNGIVFDGTTNRYTTQLTTLLATSSVFIVASVNKYNNYDILGVNTPGVSAHNGFVYSVNGNANFFVQAFGGGTVAGINPLTVSLNINYLYEVLYAYQSGGTMYINGSNTISLVSAGLDNVNSPTVMIGGSTTGFYNSFFEGTIREIIIYDRLLSTSQRQAVEVYLGQKWTINTGITKVFNNLLNTETTGYISGTGLQSTVAGLATTNYISVSQITSTTSNLQVYASNLVTSTIIGLGSIGYISVSQLTSTVGSFAAIDRSNLISTVNTLGNFAVGYPAYISSLSLQSTVAGLGTTKYVSLTQLTSTTSNILSGAPGIIQSTIDGLGNLTYISTKQLISTVNGSSNVYQSNLISTVNTLGSPPFSYVSSATLQATVTGWSNTYVSQLQVQNQYTTDINTTSITFVSTVNGLGTLGYISVPQLTSTIDGFAALNTSNLISTVNTLGFSGTGFPAYISSASLVSTVNGVTLNTFNLSNLTSTTSNVQFGLYGTTSTLNGLGTSVYIGLPQLTSTVTSFTNTNDSNLVSMVNTLGSSGYISSLSLQSTVAGLGTAGYISLAQLTSTTRGIEATRINPTALQLWLDASDPNGNGVSPANGTNITSWKDKSGNSRHAAGYGINPYTEMSLNSLPGITSIFQGTQYTSSSNYFISPIPSNTFTNAFTFFVVYKSLGNTLNDFTLINRTINSYDPAPFMMGDDGPTVYIGLPNSYAQATYKLSSNTSPTIINISLDQQGQTIKMFSSGSAVTLTPPGPWTPSDTGTELFIGRRSDNAYSFNGIFYEILLYNTILTDPQRQEIEQYLGQKWNIPTAVPPSLPQPLVSSINGLANIQNAKISTYIDIEVPLRQPYGITFTQNLIIYGILTQGTNYINIYTNNYSGTNQTLLSSINRETLKLSLVCDGTTVYANGGNDTIVCIPLSTGIATVIPFPFGSISSLCLDSTDPKLYKFYAFDPVSNNNKVYRIEIDPVKLTIIQVIILTTISDIGSIAIDSRNEYIYVANLYNYTLKVSVLGGTPTFVDTGVPSGLLFSRLIAIDPIKQLLYRTSGSTNSSGVAISQTDLTTGNNTSVADANSQPIYLVNVTTIGFNPYDSSLYSLELEVNYYVFPFYYTIPDRIRRITNDSAYISTLTFQSKVANLGSIPFSYISAPSLVSNVINLGTFGYLSTPYLTSTTAGLEVPSNIFTSTTAGLGQIYISTSALKSITPDTYTVTTFSSYPVVDNINAFYAIACTSNFIFYTAAGSSSSYIYRNTFSGQSQTIFATGPYRTLACDLSNVYAAYDAGNTIVSINIATSIMTSLTTNTSAGYLDGSNPATVQFNGISAMCIDPTYKYLYIADTYNFKLRRLQFSPFNVTTVTDFSPVENPVFTSITIDSIGKTVYMGASNVIAVVSLYGSNVNLVPFGPNFGLWIDPSENLHIVIRGSYGLFSFSNTGIIKINVNQGGFSLIAGDESTGNKDGIGSNARFNTPEGCIFNPYDSCIYINDRSNGSIRKITTPTYTSTIFGLNAAATVKTIIASNSTVYNPVTSNFITVDYALPPGSRVTTTSNIYLSNFSTILSQNLYASNITAATFTARGGRSTGTPNWGFYYGDGTYVTSISDSRLKEDIRPIENALEKVSSLQAVTYRMYRDPSQSWIGYIAQDLEVILPDIVRTDDSPEQWKSIQYTNLPALIIEAVKELNEKYERIKYLLTV